MKNFWVIALVLVVILSFAKICPAQEKTITVSGSVVLLDLANKAIKIEYNDENNIVKTLDLILSETIELFGLSSLEELRAGDNVTVDYLIDEQNTLKAVYLYKFPPPQK